MFDGRLKFYIYLYIYIFKKLIAFAVWRNIDCTYFLNHALLQNMYLLKNVGKGEEGYPHHHSCGRFSTVLSRVLVAEDSACWRPWRPCCCWRSYARRPAACAYASPSPAPTCCATSSWRWVSRATTATPVTAPWKAGRLSCSQRSISPLSPPLHPPPRPPPLRSPAGKKGLQVRQITASWAGPSWGARCSATAAAARATAGAGWPCPWTSRPTSWMCCSTWPKPNTCAPKRPRTRVCWLTLGAGSEHVAGRLGKQSFYQLTAMTSVGLFSAEKCLFTLKHKLLSLVSPGGFFSSFCSHVLFLGSWNCWLLGIIQLWIKVVHRSRLFGKKSGLSPLNLLFIQTTQSHEQIPRDACLIFNLAPQPGECSKQNHVVPFACFPKLKLC